MVRTIDAQFTHGKFEPKQWLPLREGQMVTITVVTLPNVEDLQATDSFQDSAGAWANLLDCDAFEQHVRERRHQQRPATEL